MGQDITSRQEVQKGKSNGWREEEKDESEEKKERETKKLCLDQESAVSADIS